MYNIMHISSLRVLAALMIAVGFAPSSSAEEVDQSASQAEAQHVRKGHTILVVQEGLGQVIAFSTANVYHRKVIDVGEKPHEIELTPDGRTAFVSNFGLLEVNHQIGTPGTTISVLDVRRGMERSRFDLPSGYTAPHGLKLRPPHYRELFTNTEVGHEAMVVFGAESGKVLRTFGLPHSVHNFIFNADGVALFAFTTTGKGLRIDPEQGTVVASVAVASPRGLAWTWDQQHLIVGGNNALIFLNPSDLTVASQIRNLGTGQIFYPSATPDGRWILAGARSSGWRHSGDRRYDRECYAPG
jgi:DNA-binding beta-propeller fold protein YncE